jgi:hypothetical protein
MKLSFNYGKYYQKFHKDNPKYFSGKLGQTQVEAIKRLVDWSQPDRILDYGSGKGYQYLEKRVHEQWGGNLPYCYDPGVIQLQEKPSGKFAGIICTDVMEHIAPADVDAVLNDIFASIDYSGKCFVYFNICTREAGKTFEDGQNVHLTVRPADWWNAQLQPFEQQGLQVHAEYAD